MSREKERLHFCKMRAHNYAKRKSYILMHKTGVNLYDEFYDAFMSGFSLNEDEGNDFTEVHFLSELGVLVSPYSGFNSSSKSNDFIKSEDIVPKTWHEFFGCDKFSSKEDVAIIYRDLLRKYHPQNNKTGNKNMFEITNLFWSKFIKNYEEK